MHLLCDWFANLFLQLHLILRVALIFGLQTGFTEPLPHDVWIMRRKPRQVCLPPAYPSLRGRYGSSSPLQALHFVWVASSICTKKTPGASYETSQKLTEFNMAESLSKAHYSKEEHEAQAGSYGQYETIPLGVLEHQLYASTLGDCKGLTVLDLGGGQGLRARQAIEHGAVAVDVVDRRGYLFLAVISSPWEKRNETIRSPSNSS